MHKVELESGIIAERDERSVDGLCMCTCVVSVYGKAGRGGAVQTQENATFASLAKHDPL